MGPNLAQNRILKTAPFYVNMVIRSKKKSAKGVGDWVLMEQDEALKYAAFRLVIFFCELKLKI